MAAGIDHAEHGVRHRIDEIGPVGEGTGESVEESARSRDWEETEAISDSLAMARRIDTRERREDVVGRVRDQRRVMVREKRSVVLKEIQQMRHLLEIGWDIRVITCEVDVVELHINDVLNFAAGRVQSASLGMGSDRSENERCEREWHKQ